VTANRAMEAAHDIEPDVTAAVRDPTVRATRDAAAVRESRNSPERFGEIFGAYFTRFMPMWRNASDRKAIRCRGRDVPRRVPQA
jgi:hypothetical protein